MAVVTSRMERWGLTMVLANTAHIPWLLRLQGPQILLQARNNGSIVLSLSCWAPGAMKVGLPKNRQGGGGADRTILQPLFPKPMHVLDMGDIRGVNRILEQYMRAHWHN